jgi:hypothetical protein
MFVPSCSLDSVVTAPTLGVKVSTGAGSPSGSSALGPQLTISELSSSESGQIPLLSESSSRARVLGSISVPAPSKIAAMDIASVPVPVEIGHSVGAARALVLARRAGACPDRGPRAPVDGGQRVVDVGHRPF